MASPREHFFGPFPFVHFVHDNYLQQNNYINFMLFHN